jgi:RHS repeat-associated protein
MTVILAEPDAGGVCCNYVSQTTTSINSYPYGAILLELNGDGRTDVLGWTATSTMSGYTASAVPALPSGVQSITGGQPRAIDLDGDGLDEIVDITDANSGQIYVWRNVNGVLQSPVATAAIGSTFISLQQLRNVDIDGDGRQDLIVRQVGGGYRVWRSEATPSDPGGVPPLTDLGQSGTGTLMTPDINGDGLADIIILGNPQLYGGTETLEVYLSKGRHGTGAGESIFFGGTTMALSTEYDAQARVIDYNADGFDDLMLPLPTSSNSGTAPCAPHASTAWCVLLSTGSGYSLSNDLNIGGPVPGRNFNNNPPAAQAVIVDVNADGYRDLLMTTVGTPGQWLVRSHAGPRANLLTGIADGLGNDVGVTHQQLSEIAYSGTATAPTTRMVRSAAQSIVKSYTMEDGAGTPYTTNYTYTNARRDMTGRGFLGFEKVKVTDTRSNNPDQETTFVQVFPWIGRTALQTQYRPGTATLVSQFDPAWLKISTTHGTDPAQTHVVFTDYEDTKEYETEASSGALGLIVRSTRRDTTLFNTTHGTPQNESIAVTGVRPSTTSSTTTIVRAFDDGIASTGVYCLGRVTQETTIIGNEFGTTTRQAAASWHPSTCANETETVGADGPLAERLVSTHVTDSFGRLESTTLDDGNGSLAGSNQQRRVTFTYGLEEDARPATETALVYGESGHTTTRTWNVAFGLQLTETDAREQTTTWDFDDFGRLQSAVRPEGVTDTVTYTACGSPACIGQGGKYRVTTSSTDGVWSETQHDQLGQTIGQLSMLPNDTISYQRTTWNDLGQVTATSVPTVGGVGTYEVTQTYDLIGRPKVETRPTETGTAQTTIVYSGLGVTTTDGNGNPTYRESHGGGYLLKVTDALGKTYWYEHNGFGELTRIQDPGGHVTTLTFDQRGFQRTVDDPNSTLPWVTEYNVFGEVWRTRTPKTASPNWTMTMSYDQLGRRTQRIEAEGTTTWEYFADNTATEKRHGLLKKVTGPLEVQPTGFQEEYFYNALAQTRQVRTSMDAVTHDTDMTYYQGRLATMLYPKAMNNIRYQFNWQYTRGYATSVAFQSGLGPIPIWTLNEADALGREKNIELGMGSTAVDKTYGYHPGSQRLTSIQTNQSTTSLQNYAYQWDNVGNLTERRRLGTGGVEEDFAYDTLNRLTATSLNNQTTAAISYQDSLGNTGNIQTKSDYGTYTYGQWGAGPNAVTSVTAPESMTYHYNANGSLDCRGWNPSAGNCPSGDVADEMQWTSYNLPTRLERGIHSTTVEYGPDRQRIKQVAMRTYQPYQSVTWNVGPHFEKRHTQVDNRTTHRLFVAVNGRVVYLLVTDETPGQGHQGSTFNAYSYYVHHDHQGSWDLLSREGYSATEQIPYSFDAFGYRRDSDWTVDENQSEYAVERTTQRGYTGHEHLDSVRLIHMNGRVQDPLLGRMISLDPLLGDISNPATLNRYAYVLNNPLSYTDPTGFAEVCVGVIDLPQECTEVGGDDAGSTEQPGENSSPMTEEIVVTAESPYFVVIYDIAVGAMGGAGNWAFENSPVMWLFGDEAPVKPFDTPNSGAGETAAVLTQGVLTIGSLGRANAAKSLGANPFKGRTPQQIDKLLRDRGFIPKGPDPASGRGSYINPETGRKYYLDPGGTYRKGTELPHVDVHRMRDGVNLESEKRKLPLGDDLYE